MGGLIEDELRFSSFATGNKTIFHSACQKLRANASYTFKRAFLIQQMTRAHIQWARWTPTEKLHVGQRLINILLAHTNLIEVKQVSKSARDTRYMVTATEETLGTLETNHELCELALPLHGPTVIEPRDWTTPFDGGYHGALSGRLVLVKTFHQRYLEELLHVDMPQVYSAINTIQKTAWAINTPLLDVLKTIWRAGGNCGGLPSRCDEIPLPCSLAPDLDPLTLPEDDYEEFITWKRQAAETYERNVTNRSRRMLVSQIITIAEKYADEPSIYFPHTLDFRGRVYAVPNFLNPQGPDCARALLRFSDGKPILDKPAERLLAVHGANMLGYDKMSFDQRAEKILAMTDEIIQIASDPLQHRQWLDADKPFQFLAFCLEWAEYQRTGFGYVSHLPVALDGTCNGLQHFSAMLCDEVGGFAVNLLPSDKPQDIYEQVADRVTQQLLDMLTINDTDTTKMAQKWLDFGISRKLTKRPVMILPYGGTLFSCRQYIEDYLREVTENGTPNLFKSAKDDGLFEASGFLAPLVWSGIREVVVSACEAMDWLRQVAIVTTRANVPLVWNTPSGFPVYQFYQSLYARRIVTKLYGSVIKRVDLTLRVPDERRRKKKIDKRRQCNGISPNFVHSLDAAVLHCYVNKANLRGLKSFALIHDSFATLAADTQTSVQTIRETFVDIYRGDVLADFKQQLLSQLPPTMAEDIPELPPKGKLDISDILQSDYFFA